MHYLFPGDKNERSNEQIDLESKKNLLSSPPQKKTKTSDIIPFVVVPDEVKDEVSSTIIIMERDESNEIDVPHHQGPDESSTTKSLDCKLRNIK